MTSHGRKYGDTDSHPIPVWNGIFDHFSPIGVALWVFLWLIDRIPKNGERDGIGKVLGGKPIKIDEITGSIKGSTYKGIRLQLDTLEEGGYITRRRTSYGYVIEVRNSRKWNIWATKESGQKGQSPPRENALRGQSDGERLPLEGSEIAPGGRNKENTAVHSSKANAAAAFWQEAELDPARLPGPFVKLCQDLYATKNGQPLGGFMGVCMDAWEAMGGKKHPPAFAKAKARIVERERIALPPTAPIAFLPDVPFKAKEKPCPKKN